MIQKPKGQESRHKEMLDGLKLISEIGYLKTNNKHEAQQIKKCIELVTFSLKKYIEPWICPDCGRVTKIPYCDKNPTHCIHCQNNNMLPYGYQEVKRMDAQLRITYDAIQQLANEGNEVAIKASQQLAELKLS